MHENLVVPEDRAGIELDEFLCLHYPDVHKGFLRDQIRQGVVLVDGRRAVPSKHLRRDQVVSIGFREVDTPQRPQAPARLPDVLHEDDAVLVIDKPPGVAVEPERWAPDAPCVSAGLLELARSRSDDKDHEEGVVPFRPRLVHRLDKDTTGVLLVAKNIEAERALRAAFDEERVNKEYLALVEGELGPDEVLEIDAPIGPDARKSGRMRVVSKGGKPSRTTVVLERAFQGFSLVRARPHTGRTHQIRVHLAHEGFPLLVDPFYGRREEILLSEIKRGYRPKKGQAERPILDRLALHAHRLTFPDIACGEGELTVESPLPKDLERITKQLEKCRPPRRPSA